MNEWLILWIVGSIGVIAAHSAQAAPMSCTDYKSICLSKGSKKCDGAWKQCMRTGIYIGPDSGTITDRPINDSQRKKGGRLSWRPLSSQRMLSRSAGCR